MVRRPLLALALIILAGTVAGCDGKRLVARVGDAELPDALGTIEPPAGETMILLPDRPDPDLPKAAVIRIAAHRDVPWLRIHDLVGRIRAQGSTPAILIGDRGRVRAMELSEALESERPMQLTVSADAEFCLWAPGADNAACVKGTSKRHISSAHVREYVRQGVTGARFHDVLVWAEPTVTWADVVRAVDGARTCCRGTNVRVATADPNHPLK